MYTIILFIHVWSVVMFPLNSDLSNLYVLFLLISICCCSVPKLCPTLCNLMDLSIPGSPASAISQSLLKVMSTESVMLSNHLILCHPFLLLPSIFPASGSFPMGWLFASGGQSIGASASASVLPLDIQGWIFPLGLTGLISLQSKGLSRVFSTLQFKSISFSALSLLYGPTLTSIYDYWKNHSCDYTDICQQSDVSAF